MNRDNKILQRYAVTQPGQQRLSVQTETGFRSFLYFHIHEISIEREGVNDLLYVHHARYLIRLGGKNLRTLYLSLLVEEVLEISIVEAGSLANESCVSQIDIMENLELNARE
jgi:hypothetical protein